MFTAVAGGVAASVTVEVRGEIVSHDVAVLKLAATKGLFASVVEEQVTYVNAPQLAADRGVEVELVTDDEVDRPPEPGDRARRAAGRPHGQRGRHA